MPSNPAELPELPELAVFLASCFRLNSKSTFSKYSFLSAKAKGHFANISRYFKFPSFSTLGLEPWVCKPILVAILMLLSFVFRFPIFFHLQLCTGCERDIRVELLWHGTGTPFCFKITLPETNLSHPWKELASQKRKQSSSNHPFSGANSLFQGGWGRNQTRQRRTSLGCLAVSGEWSFVAPGCQRVLSKTFLLTLYRHGPIRDV